MMKTIRTLATLLLVASCSENASKESDLQAGQATKPAESTPQTESDHQVAVATIDGASPRGLRFFALPHQSANAEVGQYVFAPSDTSFVAAHNEAEPLGYGSFFWAVHKVIKTGETHSSVELFDVQYEIPNAYLIPIVPPEEVAKGDVVITSKHGSYIDRAYVVEAGENPRANFMRAMPFDGDYHYDLESGKFGSLLEPYQPGAPVGVRVAGEDALGIESLSKLPSLEIAMESPDSLELYTVVRVVGDKVILTGHLGKIRLTSKVATVPIAIKGTYKKGDKVLGIWETPFFRSATYARFDRKTGHHLVRFKGDNEDKRVPLGEILPGSKADYLGEGVSDEPEVWDEPEFDSDGASALPEGASVVGKYDTGTIRRYMRRKLPRIQYCYEKELIKQSNLEGTVVAQFSINKDGKVRNAKASGMGSKVVEKCIAKAISSIRFPIPKSGSSTKVRYPFTFTPHQ